MDFLGIFYLGAVFGLCLFFISFITEPRYAPIKRGEWLGIIGTYIFIAVITALTFGLSAVLVVWLWNRL